MFNRIDKITLQLTTDCNMDCMYCQQPKEIESTFEDLQGLKNFIKNLPLGDRLEIRFIGGEVSPYPDRIRQAVRVIKEIELERDIKITFSLATNGTNYENLKKLMDIIPADKMAISWDGLENGTMRRSSFPDQYFLHMVRELAPYGVNFVYCVTPASVGNMAESVDFITRCGGKSFSFYFVHEADYDNEDFYKVYEEQITRIGKMFVADYPDLNRRWQYHNWNVLYHNMKNPGDTKCKNLGRVLHVDTYGDVFPCVYFGDHLAMQLGDIYNGFDEVVLREFNDQFFREPSCGGCDLSHCFECPGSEYVHNGHLHNRFGNTCRLRAIERRVFLKLFPRINITMMDEKFFWYNDLKDEPKFPNNHRLTVGNIVIQEDPIPSKKVRLVQRWFDE